MYKKIISKKKFLSAPSGGYGDITRDPEFKRMGENFVGVIQRKVKNK